MCGARRPARSPRAARRPFARARPQDPHFGRRTLQLYECRCRDRTISCRPTRISPSRRSAATRRPTSSHWSSGTASLGMRRPSGNCSATARRGRSSPCCSMNALPAGSRRRSAHAATVDHRDGGFEIAAGDRRPSAPALVLASGGLSIPKLGATGFAYDVARRFGLKIVEPRPALVPLTLSGDAGAVPLAVRCCRRRRRPRRQWPAFREAALFTHRGLSGPAILQVSSYWRHGEPLRIDFLPDLAARLAAPGQARRAARGPAPDCSAAHLPDRLAETLAEQLGLAGRARQPTRPRAGGGRAPPRRWRFQPQRQRRASPRPKSRSAASAPPSCRRRRWRAKRVPGLHAIGEAVDVTGWLGGYNFQWAWASAAAAAAAL